MPRYSALAVAAALVAVGHSDAATCPAAYFTGNSYAAAQTVSVYNPSSATLDDVYKCREAPLNLFCGQVGFEPGTSLYWTRAWSKGGTCTPGPGHSYTTPATPAAPVIVPASAPLVPPPAPAPSGGGNANDYPVPNFLGACPGPWVEGVPNQGDLVANADVVYKCKLTVMGLHCKQRGYEPGVAHSHNIGSAPLWSFVWDVQGSCSGGPAPVVPAPTPAMVPVSAPTLPVVQGCPAGWTPGVPYTTGSQVTYTAGSTFVVYTCGPYPVSGHCDDAVYKPGTSYATMTGAWVATATCTGTLTPTAAPIAYTGACYYMNNGLSLPVHIWSDVASYSAGDVVRVGDQRYKCKPHPSSLWCGQLNYAPGYSTLWTTAWTTDGTCPPPAPSTPGPTTGPTPPPPPTKSPTSPPTTSPTPPPPPTTSLPSSAPSPTRPSHVPSKSPSAEPSSMPSDVPSALPNFVPSEEPSMVPSNKPSGEPSLSPSDEPSGDPSSTPSDEPSVKPSMEPSMDPSDEPSDEPSQVPTGQPSKEPSDVPSLKPSAAP